MASQRNDDRPQPAVSFTLPISCQVCLGKVKQPVVCPNLHVFCERCLEVWLKRNNQCPSCRAPMGPSNPAKHIIGGQAEEEHPTRQSCPELRRARFDLLYLEYEDQIEQLKKENLILRTENNILVSQVKEGDKAKENGKIKPRQGPSGESGNKTSNPDGPSLLMLTRNLQEAQKLYTDIKGDMTRLKQENGKMKDENIALTRENETLRLELAQRSPKKFGRYTVATLETKISEQEKEIRQLTKALERCDSYIEELQQKCSRGEANAEGHGKENEDVQGAKSVSKFNFNMEPSQQKQPSRQKQKQALESFSFRCDQPLPTENARRLLFGKMFQENPGSIILAKAQGKSIPAPSGSKSTAHEAEASSRQESPRDGAEVQRPLPDSILKPQSSASKDFISHPETNMETDQMADTPRSPKRVHFDEPPPPPRTPEESPSFDLELPSPMERSTFTPTASQSQSQSLANTNAELVSSNVEEESPWEDSEFDIKVKDLLRKNAQRLKRSVSLEKASSQPSTSAKKSNKGQQAKTKKGTSAASKTSKKPVSQDVNDSSRLSVPDMSSGNASNDFSGMDSPEQDVKPNVADLNVSMTPEFTDCLRLMDKAERNMVSAPSAHSVPDARGTASVSSTSTLPSRPSSVPPHLSRPLASSSNSHYSTGFSASVTGSDVSKPWEQQFYNSLRTNPYKQLPSNGPQQQETFLPFSAIGKLEPPDQDYEAVSSSTISSSLYSNSTPRGMNGHGDFTNKLPESCSFSFPDLQNQSYEAKGLSQFQTHASGVGMSHNSGVSKTPSSFGMGTRSSTALPNKFDLPVCSSSSMAPRVQVTSSSYGSVSSVTPATFSFTALMAQASSSSSSSAEKFKFTAPNTFNFPSNGRIGNTSALSSHTNKQLSYSNPAQASLNNSSLDWPEGSTLGKAPYYGANQANRDAAGGDLDLTEISQLKDFCKGDSNKNAVFSRSQANAQYFPHDKPYRHHHHQQWHAIITDDSFRAAMEPPTSGYPQDLSHETSSTSEFDPFTSPRVDMRRRFSFPFASENLHGGAGGTEGLDDFLDKP